MFYKIINTVYAKTMANMGTYKNIKFVRNDRKRNNLAWKPNYKLTKWLSENVITIDIAKTQVQLKKTVYLGFEFWIWAK